MKIAIYSGEIPSATFIENLIIGLAEHKHEIILFGQIKRKVNYKENNIIIRATPDSKLKLLLFIIWQYSIFQLKGGHDKSVLKTVLKEKNVQRLRKKLIFYSKLLPVLNNKPDIFHVQWIKDGIDWDFLPQFGVKLVGSFRGAHINYTPIVYPNIVPKYADSFPRFHAFHAVSQAIANEAVKYGSELTKTKVIPGAVFPELLEQEAKVNTNIVVKILSVGRRHWKKGYADALDACKLLIDDHIDFEYTIIGGVGKEEIPFQRNELGLNNKVKFVDRMPHDELLKMYKQVDVFLLPSVEEGIANVVLEAMAIGVPVISTNCGGMSEVIENGINGWIVPARCPSAMAESIKKFITCNQEQKLSIINNARLTIKKSHLIPNQIKNMMDLYDDVWNDEQIRKGQLV